MTDFVLTTKCNSSEKSLTSEDSWTCAFKDFLLLGVNISRIVSLFGRDWTEQWLPRIGFWNFQVPWFTTLITLRQITKCCGLRRQDWSFDRRKNLSDLRRFGWLTKAAVKWWRVCG